MSADNLPRPASPAPWRGVWDDDSDEFVIDMRADQNEIGYRAEELIRWDHDLCPEDGEQFDRALENLHAIASLPERMRWRVFVSSALSE